MSYLLFWTRIPLLKLRKDEERRIMKKDQKIYYIGRRSSDISTDFNANVADTFFAGSITCYGDNRGGNISYNVISGIQLSDDDSIFGRRNDAIYTKFISDQCRNIAEKDPDALFLPYSQYYASKVPQELHDRVICCNNERVVQCLDSKINFRKIFRKQLPFPKYTIEKGARILQLIEEKIIPYEREVVIQTEFGGGGEGSYIVRRETFTEEYAAWLKAEMKSTVKYVVSEYVYNLCSVGVQILVSDDEIGIYPPSIQILNGPCYIGSDLYAFSLLDEDIKNECTRIATRFGEILRDMESLNVGKETISGIRNRGFFGIDFIISEPGSSPSVYVIETNPRFTGPVGLLNVLCYKAGIGSVFKHSFDCFTGKRICFDDFRKIEPNGRKRYAEIVRDKGGQVVSLENESSNKEGLDQTVYQEEGLYSHAVFEEIKAFNVYDDRRELKKYLLKNMKKRKTNQDQS